MLFPYAPASWDCRVGASALAGEHSVLRPVFLFHPHW